MSVSKAVWFLTYPIILNILILIIIESLFKNEKEKKHRPKWNKADFCFK